MNEISLDGTLHSKLDWSAQRLQAQNCDNILWNIDLGLFKNLPQPLSSASQYQSLKLSLEHFCNTLWEPFKDKTVGICLYKGTVDFSADFPWDDEQEQQFQEWLKRGGVSLALEGREHFAKLFCRDVAGEYLDLLSGYLPEGLDAYISFDTHNIKDPLLRAQLTTKERFPHVKLIIDGKEESQESVGVCLPSMYLIDPVAYRDFPNIFRKLENTPYRVIPEELLTSEWHGLDILYVVPSTLSPLGHRKLQGFQATGGIVEFIITTNSTLVKTR